MTSYENNTSQKKKKKKKLPIILFVEIFFFSVKWLSCLVNRCQNKHLKKITRKKKGSK